MVSCLHLSEPDVKQDIMEGSFHAREKADGVLSPKRKKGEKGREVGSGKKKRKWRWEEEERKSMHYILFRTCAVTVVPQLHTLMWFPSHSQYSHHKENIGVWLQSQTHSTLDSHLWILLQDQSFKHMVIFFTEHTICKAAQTLSTIFSICILLLLPLPWK